ncbi:DEAD/DEAH box helicase [Aquimarina algiphila]|uniref:DEAD/DEAH box helicase n=1 Tax=Aquimarina algiphila TaxID=2047982 RepID=UPI002330428F|nr:DEAD/DEAH box helicase [Aquimarina algiphila]
MDSFCICYNLVSYPNIELPPLPEAYIVAIKENHLGYIEKQAIPSTLESFNISYYESPHEQILGICNLLKSINLEQRFQPKKSRKKLKLSELVKDKKTKEIIVAFINRKLALFYNLVYENQYPLCFRADRKDPVSVSQIHFSNTALDPLLTFKKTNDGIEYSFSLSDHEKEYIPSQNEITILLNDPAWIVLNKKVYQINNINANKLKPFFTKEVITIAQKHIKTYVEKIIIPVIKNIDISAVGFDIQIKNSITGYTIEIIEDFIKGNYVAKVIFEYDTDIFDHYSQKSTASHVHFGKKEELQIIQTRRDTGAENKIIDLLTSKGLSLNDNLLLETATEDSFSIFQWYTNHESQLSEEGFKSIIPKIDNKNILLAPHAIQFDNQQQSDWFDIKGVITIGDLQIPFSKFVNHIKENNRFFSVDDDTIFLIPDSWMTRYRKLASFGKVEEEKIIINKSNYTILQEVLTPEEIDIQNPTETSYTQSPLLKARLRPYQEKGVQWLVQHNSNNLGACLADDMGLGKTLQTIATLAFTKDQLTPQENEVEKIKLDLFSNPLEIKTFLKALIILPSSLIFNWAQEILKFAPHFSIIKYTGSDRKKIAPYLESYDVILTTYTTATKDISVLEKINFNYLILDESQQIKNKDSKLFSAINKINSAHKISLSGTPIENSLSDLWSQMQFINPGILGSFPFFKEYFKIPIEKHRNQERIEELKTLIDPFILRRTKEQVAKDLPELTEQIIYTEMHSSQEKQYVSEKSAARNLLLGIDSQTSNKIHILNTLNKLRQLANHPKLINSDTDSSSGKFEDVTNYITTLVKADKKVLIFSSFVSHLQLYTKWCDTQNITYVTLTGQTKGDEREQVVNQFQENESTSVFFISLKAGGVGLNLTKASYVILLDPWWNPFIEKQAIARSHRIGQTSNVMVTRFITKNTIEEKILQLQEKKKDLSDEIIDVNAIPQYVEQDLEELLT